MSKMSLWFLGFLMLAFAFTGTVNAVLEDAETLATDNGETNDNFGNVGIRALVSGDTGNDSKETLGTIQMMTDDLSTVMDTGVPVGNGVGLVDTDELDGGGVFDDDDSRNTLNLDADIDISDEALIAVLVDADGSTAGIWLVTDSDAEGGEAYLIIQDGAGGTLNVYTPVWVNIHEGDFDAGNHDLDGLEGTTIRSDEGTTDDPVEDPTDEVRTASDGKYLVRFHVPLNLLSSCVSFMSAIRFNGDPDGVDEGAIPFGIQAMVVEDADTEPDNNETVRNGDTVEIDLDLEDAFGNLEDVTVLPDFSMLDSAFPVPVLTTAVGLMDFVDSIRDALNSGMLVIDHDDGGDYKITYTISDENDLSSGSKIVTVYVIAFPSSSPMEDIKAAYEAAGLDARLASMGGDICDTMFTNGMFDTDPFELDNLAPNFDIALPNPFVNPPCSDMIDGKLVYYYKPGDVVEVFIQFDPHDLSVEELDEEDPPDNPGDYDDGVPDLDVDGVSLYLDLSALLDPDYLLANPQDSDGNGIPDVAQVLAVDGDSDGDEDFDGEDSGDDNDDDSTVNGINERFLKIGRFTIDENFQGVSGNGPATTGPLPIRFLIEDEAGNRMRYSAAQEIFDVDAGMYVDATPAEWVSPLGRDPDFLDVAPADGIIDMQNPIMFDKDDIPPITNSGSFARVPDATLFPNPSKGRTIFENWDQPWWAIIDAAYPTVSVISAIKMGVTTTDPAVAMGAAVAPGSPLAGGTDYLLPGDFMHEVTGNEDSLVTFDFITPSDNDVVKLHILISLDGGLTYVPMKAPILGDVQIPGLYDMAGVVVDPGVPGIDENNDYHDGINGDDDGDGDPDFGDDEVNDAVNNPQGDTQDNDADGLVDNNDRAGDGSAMEVYDAERDDDEDGIMDEDEWVVPVVSGMGSWTFDPVRIVRSLGLQTSRAYPIKAVPYDCVGNAVEKAGAPFFVIFRVVGEGIAEVEGSAGLELYDGEVLPENLVTSKYIYENRVYTMRAVPTGTVDSVTFARSLDGTVWTDGQIMEYSGDNPDINGPTFQIEWRPILVPGGGIDESNPADGIGEGGTGGYEDGDDLHLRATAGKFGELGRYDMVGGSLTLDPEHFAPYTETVEVPVPDEEESADLVVAIVDASAPVMVITQLGLDMVPGDGALLPLATDVLLKATTDAPDISDAYWELGTLTTIDGEVHVVWELIPCTTDLTALPNGGYSIVSKWDTRAIEPGLYDIRCIGVDSNDLFDEELAPISHIIVGHGKKVAFIEAPVHGATIPGPSYDTLTARIYYDWDSLLDTVDPGGDVFDDAEEDNMVNDIVRVIFQYRSLPDGPWILITSVPSMHEYIEVYANYADWIGSWDLYDLEGTFEIRALTEDDKGYVTPGIPSLVTVSGSEDLRTEITNFSSDATQNEKVSMLIARDGGNDHISIYDGENCDGQGMMIKLIAEQWPGTVEPDAVVYEYKMNPLTGPVNPKNDTGWTPINLADADHTALENSTGGLEIEWKIPAVWDHDDDDATPDIPYSLHNLPVATLIYVRARAVLGDAASPDETDEYTDETDFVPFVGLVFQENVEPTLSVEKLLRADGTGNIELAILPQMNVDSPFASDEDGEYRLTPGSNGDTQELIIISSVYDNDFLEESGNNPVQMSSLSKVELWLKLCRADSFGDVPVASSTESPYVLTWDFSEVPTGKYELLVTLTDKAGNRSANPLCADVEDTIIITIDRSGPDAYVEDPDGVGPGDDGRVDCEDRDVLVSVSSYEGCIEVIELQYGRVGFLEDIPTESIQEEYTFEWQDLNKNGVWDTDEPWRIVGAPVDTGSGEWQDPDIVDDIAWTTIGEKSLTIPNFAAGGIPVSADFVGGDGEIYWYFDVNDNDRYDAREPVWKDKDGGNCGRYNNHARTVREDVIMGSWDLVDEMPGKRFEAIPSANIAPWSVMDLGCCDKEPISYLDCFEVTVETEGIGITKWADIDGYDGVDNDGDGLIDETVADDEDNGGNGHAEKGELSQGDFIWVDMPDCDGDNDYNGEFDGSEDGVCEPIVYASVNFNWDSIMNLPPTNNSVFELRARARDKNDSSDKIGNWGPYYTGSVNVQNIQVAIMSVNDVEMGDFNNINWRVTGDSVDVVVRVWPNPSDGSEVELWYRYDNLLYPGPADADHNGGADNSNIVNSQYDGINNDWDVNDAGEELIDEGAEVNVWRKAVVTGGSTVIDSGGDDNWFDVRLTWDISMMVGEFQYNIMPIVIDSQNYGVDFNYDPAPTWISSLAPFPQDCLGHGRYEDEYKIIVDHQGPYTYTQVVLNSADMYSDDDVYKRGLNSWKPLDACEPDDMIIRTNNYAGDGDYRDELGEDNYTVFDIQVKVVSIYGGLDYTKSFDDMSGGAEIQYRTVDGDWMTLGYDYEPDFISSFVYDSGTYAMACMEIDRGYPTAMYDWYGDVIKYSGYILGVVDDEVVVVDNSAEAYTQRIVVATFSLDNVDISDTAVFPSTGIGSAEYQFRAVINDQPDEYGDMGTRTGDTPTTKFDELVVKNLVGDGNDNAVDDQNFMRDINWQLGAPFACPALTTEAIFNNPGGAVEEYVMGPRSLSNLEDDTYTVNNRVPMAELIRVDTTTFPWTPEAGVDQLSLENELDANVHVGDEVLIEAIANPDPGGVGVWGTTPDVAGDIVDANGIAEVRLYARPHKGDHKDTDNAAPSNEWIQVGMGDLHNPPAVDPEAGQSDFPNEGNIRYTFRLSVNMLKRVFSEFEGCEYELMALAIDKDCNAEPFLAAEGELVMNVLDFVGPDIAVGGLALDSNHYANIIADLDFGGVAGSILGPYLSVPFTDPAGLDLNNFGNGVFPANPHLVLSDAPELRRPLAKVSGELLQLYAVNCCNDCEGAVSVTFTVYNKDNEVVYEDVVTTSDDGYSKDVDGDNPAMVKHTFTLSEQVALLYLPTWTEVDGNISRFENVWLRIYEDSNKADANNECLGYSGSFVDPPDAYSGSVADDNVEYNVTTKAAMTRHVNSKGENIWTVDRDLKMGKTYFYYFLVDTVGHNWTIPDPKNLMVDEFLGGRSSADVIASLNNWLNSSNGGIVDNAYHNLPVITKIWVPGSPGGTDDEIFYTTIDLDRLPDGTPFPDGVYEVRVTGTDRAGFTDMVSKTIVVDRTPPPVDPDADIKVDSRVKASTIVDMKAILHDVPETGVNVVDTVAVLFNISRRGNTQEAVSTWQYAIDEVAMDLPSLGVPAAWQALIPSWLLDVSVDLFPDDGWSSGWMTPTTDQNVPWHVRVVPFDDALNPQVNQGNQKLVIVDGSVPKAKVLRASVTRAGALIEDAADEFDLYPDDTDVTLTAELVANIDGDVNGNDQIDEDLGENINDGMDSLLFQYSLKKPADPTDPASDIAWIDIPSSQYSTKLRAPNAEGKWQVTWQVDFSQLINEDHDQYIHVRAVGKDAVGNEDTEDPILAIMILHDVTGPMAHIRYVDGSNVLDPHLAVTKRTHNIDGGDPGKVDVEIEAHNVAALTLEYRKAGETSWTEVDTETNVSGMFTIEWLVASLAEGKYELRVSAFDGDGNSVTDPDIVWVIVDHTEPEVKSVTMGDFYPGDGEDAVWCYKNDDGYIDVTVEVKADATEPIDDKLTEAESVALQYFDRPTATWMDVPDPAADGVDNDDDGSVDEADEGFTYSRYTDLWTITYTGATGATHTLGNLFDTGALVEGEIQFRALVTDYAGNQNTLDRNSVFTVIADATDPDIIAVYSGGRDYEGGEECTIIARSGDDVDLWVKVMDTGSGVDTVKFFIPGSSPTDAAQCVFPVPSSLGADFIGSGELDWAVGGEELWHYKWTTPVNQKGDDHQYIITVEVSDKGCRTVNTKDDGYEGLRACVQVNKDEVAPLAPQVLFIKTHAGSESFTTVSSDEYADCDATDDSALILDEYNACDYTVAKLLPIGADTDMDAGRADKYEVFDLYTDRDGDTDDDEDDTKLEIWVRVPELEWGIQPEAAELRQYDGMGDDDPDIGYAEADYKQLCGNGPEYLKVNHGELGSDPGIVKVRVWYGFAELGVDPAAIIEEDWVPLDNDTENDPDDNNDPLDIDDIKVKELVDDDGDEMVTKGYAYYFVMGDDESESVINTAGLADGNYFLRTQAMDASETWGDYGYAMFKVHNTDEIPPANTYIHALNTDDDRAAWNVLEWKWHEVTVRTRRNEVGWWWFGNGPHCEDINSVEPGDDRNKFFYDIEKVVVEAWDPECAKWVNVTMDGSSSVITNYDVDDKFCEGDKLAFQVEWQVFIDSTMVGDGASKLRAYAVDIDGNEEDKEAVPQDDILVDNPRGQVVLPGDGTIVERGDTVIVQGVGVSPGGDPAENGHDVGRMVFLVKRKAAAEDDGSDGPWILIDAMDTDLDGEFGEPGDPVEPIDSNEPYMVHWRVPDWLVIDDPKTEHVREETAQYWVVAVAGDANTGPLDTTGQWRSPAPMLWDTDGEEWVREEPSDGIIHWDNPYRIIDCTTQAVLVTVVDEHPPQTRMLQIADYTIPSETKMVVGQTVTVFAGDTEVDYRPEDIFGDPLEFATPPFDGTSFSSGKYAENCVPVWSAYYQPVIPGDAVEWAASADDVVWTSGMLYPSWNAIKPNYDPDIEPEKSLHQEWRPNARVTLRYAGPYPEDTEIAPSFPDSGETWESTEWKTAESDAIDLGFVPVGMRKWRVTNWVTGGVLSDGKYFITITATDDVGHTTGVPVGDEERVVPDVAVIYIDNEAPETTLVASELLPDGELVPITNNEMERGRPVVLQISETMDVADLDEVTFYFKAEHDYSWTTIKVDLDHDGVAEAAATVKTQPYSVLLSPLGVSWSGISNGVNGQSQNLALGNVYQFKAVVTDGIGNTRSTNILDLTIVDRLAEAAISMIKRLDGFNTNERWLKPRMINDNLASAIPRLTGRVKLYGYTDSDVVGVTFLYRPTGADAWIEIEASMNIFDDWLHDGVDNDGDGLIDEEDEGEITPWDTAEWLTDGIDNDGDGETDEDGECGYHFVGQQEWRVVWDTTTLDGLYEVAVVANTGSGKSMEGFDILKVVVDHNAYDITDSIAEWTPTSGGWVGGRTRRPVEAENPRLDPDDKLPGDPRGEVDLCVIFPDGIPVDLDMGISTGVIRDKYNQADAVCDSPVDCGDRKGGVYGGYAPDDTALDPSLSFQWKYNTKPDGSAEYPIGDENVSDKTLLDDPDHIYWHDIDSDVIYDANYKSFCAVWRTVETGIKNGYYDIRVRIVDEAGNVAYRTFAERVVVDNTPPEGMITSINDDTTLTYVDSQVYGRREGSDTDSETDTRGGDSGGMATDTELDRDTDVIVRATVIDSLTDVAYVQFQVKPETVAVGPPLARNKDEVPIGPLGLTDWTDIGLAVADDDPENSYSLHWNTTGLPEGDYKLRIKATDAVGNKMTSGGVKVTVVDTTPPIACIAGYYPKQMQVLNWPKKYWRDTIYAVTVCQADIQEVQIQYRAVGEESWITIGVPQWIPFEQLDTMCEKLLKIGDIFFNKNLFPPEVAIDEALNEAFDWTGLWGTSWDPKNLPSGLYELRAIAKDWSGNVTPEDMAPVLTIEVEGGAALPETPDSGMEIEFTANLGSIGVGDSRFGLQSYYSTPTVVVTVTAPEKPTVLVLVEVDSPDGVIVGGEIIEVHAEEGAFDRYSAVLEGDDLLVACAGRWEGVGNYLDLIRLGGRITVFASIPACPEGGPNTVSTMAMEDLTVYPVTAELGTNGTVYSKDGNVSVTIPRASMVEDTVVWTGSYHKTLVERAGLMITPTGVMPNTPKDQRMQIEPKGKAYNIQFFSFIPKYMGFRPGFEPLITMGYDDSVEPYEEMFVSVRYWDPDFNDLYGYGYPDSGGYGNDGLGGKWANSDVINMRVNPTAPIFPDLAPSTVAFNLKAFGELRHHGYGSSEDDSTVDHGDLPQVVVPHDIYTIVVEKAFGRIDHVTFSEEYMCEYTDGPTDITYIDELEEPVYFTIIDPGGIDADSIRFYIDDELLSVNHGRVRFIRWTEEGNATYAFIPDMAEDDYVDDVTDNLSEGLHTIKIQAWDKSDAINENDWRMLETTAQFYIDTTPPMVVTHAGQRDGVRYFSSVAGATVGITIVDEGAGVDGQDIQNDMFVDVFQHLTANQTPLRTKDSGDIINFQRKTLIATSKPILEYCDDYTPDGIDNETWIGVHEGASTMRHPAWRASYTIQSGQISDGDTFEVVFYGDDKKNPDMDDYNNENAVYLFEDLTRAYLMVWDGSNADHIEVGATLGLADMNVDNSGYDDYYDYDEDDPPHGKVVVVPVTQVPDLFKKGLLDTWAQDVWWNYYDYTFLTDCLDNEDDDADFFVRHLVADKGAPAATLSVPDGITADSAMVTISASASDDASGLTSVKLLVNGEVVASKEGSSTTASLSHTFAQGELVDGTEIVLVVTDAAGNEVVERKVLGVQETDAPVISGQGPEGDSVNDATPTIAVAFSDDSGIDEDSVSLTLDGAVITDATVSGSSVSYTPTSPLEAGRTYTVKVSVKDSNGKVNDLVWTFALETDAPEITTTTPTEVDETGMPLISAKFADGGVGVDADSVRLVVDGVAVDAAVTGSSVSFKPADVMASGKHTAVLTVADVAGNVAELPWDFNIEDDKPTVSITEPATTISDDMPVLAATYSDSGTGIDVSSVKLSLNGEVQQAEVTPTQVSFGVTEPLRVGVVYTVSVTVADKAGNVGTDSKEFRLESTRPTITGNSPTTTQNTVDVPIEANFSDSGSGIDPSTALMKVDGVAVPAVASASGISYQAIGLLAGTHTVYVEVSDRFGTSNNRSWSFNVEGTPPAISSVEPSGEIGDATPDISASYSDAGTGVNVSSVVLKLGGQILPATATATGVSYTVLMPLEIGVTYKVTVEVADKAGNVASDSSTFSLETTPPEVSAMTPKGTVSEEDAAAGILVSAKLSDDGSGVNPDSASMWINGDVVAADATTESVQYTAKGLGYGDYTVRLVVSDNLGNTADESWDFSVDDSTPPTVTVISPKQDGVVGVRPVIKISYADEGSGVDLTSIDVKVDDKAVVATTMAPAKANVVSAGEASYEVRLGYGSHTLTVVVKDVAGNEAEKTVTFIVEGDVLTLAKPHNYPNPVRGGKTTITFGLSQESDITIRIYDFTATLVATVSEDERTPADENVEFTWDGMTADGSDSNQLANGVYFCQILAQSVSGSETKSEIVKIALVKE